MNVPAAINRASRIPVTSEITQCRLSVVAGAIAIRPGEKVLLTCDSRAGKSILARALAGVWPWGRGDIEIAAGGKLLVLPQRPYVPMGTLRRAVNYRDAAHSRSMAETAKVLEKVEL